MADENAAILVRGLSKQFGRRIVLDGIDLEIPAGQSVVFTGGNGAGKTTLLRCLASILRPTAGEVRWFGRWAVGQPQARRLIGMAAHESRLYPHLTVRENLLFAARMYALPMPDQRVDHLLESAGLHAHAHRKPPVLSQGMRQRLAVARAMIHDPPILLLDEPFAGFDAAATDWLLGLLDDLRSQGRTLCFVLHDPEKTRRLADRILDLRNGRLQEMSARQIATPCSAATLARAA